MTMFLALAEVLDSVTGTKKRTEKIEHASEFLRGVDKSDIGHAALYLGGKVFAESDQKTLNISWKGLANVLKEVLDIDEGEISKVYEGDIGEAVAKLFTSSSESRQSTLFSEPLTINYVAQTLDRIANVQGKGSLKEKQSLLTGLFIEASPREARYLTALVLEDMRTGMSEGLLVEVIAAAFNIDSAIVRRAWTFNGDLGQIAAIAAEKGVDGLQSVTIRLMRGIKPMLASPMSDIGSIFESHKKQFSFELKLDGARVQIHKDGSKIRIFSRRLSDMTEGLPEIVELVNEKIKADTVILDGEVLAVDDQGKPFPFQVVMKRFGRTRDIEEAYQDTKLQLVLFDVLYIDNVQLVDEPYRERRKRLEKIATSELLVERVVSDVVSSATSFFEYSQKAGHEGLVAKSLESPYIPGARGKHWFKIKHTLDTLDLVIIAAEWGHGRRKDWLSDYHLAVRDEETGEWQMVGKTYKGFTDREFEEITKRLLNLEVASNRHVVEVRPEIVVEVIASEIQESPTYESGMALRFARINRIREDKGPSEATTLEELKDLYEKQFRFKAR